MKEIQWFPGHMNKAIKEIQAYQKAVDLLIVVLDSRLPKSSMNPFILELSKSKPTLLLFNKIDLADTKLLNRHIKEYEEKGFYTLKVNSNSGFNTDKIYNKIKDEVLKEKIEKKLNKNLKFDVFKAMILGIPNVGKSSLINRIVNKKVTKIENRPGVTKMLNWIRVSKDFELLDTPGILWPKFEENVKFSLALSGSIKDDILPIDDVCIYGLLFLKKYYPNILKEFYQIDIETDDSIQMLDKIGKKIGALLKNNEIDYNRVYKAFLKDLRSEKFKGVCFDQFA